MFTFCLKNFYFLAKVSFSVFGILKVQPELFHKYFSVFGIIFAKTIDIAIKKVYNYSIDMIV